jgi:Domain of unknown function (DUF4405)
MREVLVEKRRPPRRRTVVHWMTVFLLSLSGLLTTLTSIYFLFLPSGGYQGGSNPYYGQTFLFDRHTWSDIHTWAGIVMITVSLFHFILHWQWVVEMGRRSLAVVRGRRKPFRRQIWARVGVVAILGLLFLGVAASGIYFFVLPTGQGSNRAVQFLFGRSMWDLVHTWTGVLMIIAAAVHLTMRWRWVARVTPSVTRTLVTRRGRQPEGSYV